MFYKYRYSRKKKKNKLIRTQILKKIKQKIIIKSILYNQFIQNSVKKKFIYKKLNLYNQSCSTKSICLITCRSKSILKKFRISRLIFRQFIGQGLIPGVMRSSW